MLPWKAGSSTHMFTQVLLGSSWHCSCTCVPGLGLLGIATELTGFALWRHTATFEYEGCLLFRGLGGASWQGRSGFSLRVLGKKNSWKSDLRKFVGVSISMRKVTRGLAKDTGRVTDDQRTVQVRSVLRELEQSTNHSNSFSLQPGYTMGIL